MTSERASWSATFSDGADDFRDRNSALVKELDHFDHFTEQLGLSLDLSLHKCQHDIVAGVNVDIARVRYALEFAYFSRAAPAPRIMPDNRVKERRRAGRPPAGAREGEKVKDYPQLSIRVPVEMKARLNALSAVTGLAQWRVIVEAIDCFHHDLPPTDRELVDGLSERLMRAG
jgi:predicted DNA-binding protein